MLNDNVSSFCGSYYDNITLSIADSTFNTYSNFTSTNSNSYSNSGAFIGVCHKSTVVIQNASFLGCALFPDDSSAWTLTNNIGFIGLLNGDSLTLNQVDMNLNVTMCGGTFMSMFIGFVGCFNSNKTSIALVMNELNMTSHI